MPLQVGFHPIVEQAVWWHSLWLSRVHQSIWTSRLFKCVLKWTSHGLTFIFMRELLERHYLKNNKSSYLFWMKQLSDMQSEGAFNYLIYSLIYELFSHAIIFEFASIFPSYLTVYNVQIFSKYFLWIEVV